MLSPELQAEQILAWARSRGVEVEMLSPELDESGGRLDRPILEQALRGVEGGVYVGIVVAKLDRLSRSIVHTHSLYERVEAAGGQVVAVAENIDTTTPAGRMQRNMLSVIANFELDRYREGFNVAKRSAVERGIWPTSVVPLGYRKGDDRRLVPDENAPLIRRAFEMRASGASWSEIATLLGKGISGAGKTIHNRVYLGEVRLRPRDGPAIVNPSAHEPIIERGLWEAAQIHHPPPPKGNDPALLQGLLRCESCGYSMTPGITKGRRLYRCFPRKVTGRCEAPAIIAASVIEPTVERSILAQLSSAEWSLAARTDALEEVASRLQQAEAELAAFQEVQRVEDLGADVFGAGMRSRVEAVEAIRRELAQARLSSPLIPEGGSVVDLWPELSVDERRHVLRGALSGVWVRKGRGPDRVRLVDHGGDEVRVPPAEDLG